MKDIYTALITPFNEDNYIDYPALCAILDDLIKQGNNHFVVCGTTGEVSMLTFHEKIQLIRFIRYHYPKIQLIVGISAIGTKEVIRQIKALESIEGISTFMVIVPYYVKPTQEGLYQHFHHIALSTNKNLIIYNIPGRTSCNLEVDTLLQLIKNHSNIKGMKQAGTLDKLVTVKQRFPDFKIYVGNDDQLLEALQLGFDGIVSVASHFVYPLMKDIIDTLDEDKDLQLKKIAKLIFKETSPAPIKYIMHQLGYCQNKLRLPLVPIESSLEKELNQLLEK